MPVFNIEIQGIHVSNFQDVLDIVGQLQSVAARQSSEIDRIIVEVTDLKGQVGTGGPVTQQQLDDLVMSLEGVKSTMDNVVIKEQST